MSFFSRCLTRTVIRKVATGRPKNLGKSLVRSAEWSLIGWMFRK